MMARSPVSPSRYPEARYITLVDNGNYIKANTESTTEDHQGFGLYLKEHMKRMAEHHVVNAWHYHESSTQQAYRPRIAELRLPQGFTYHYSH